MKEHLDTTQIRETVAKLKAGGSLEFQINLACWLGERAHRLLDEIDLLKEELAQAKENHEDALIELREREGDV